MKPHLFQQIAKFNRAPHLAAAYGVILYTERDAYVHKVVHDNTYCNALNEVSGDRWVLFAARAKRGTLAYPKFPPGTVGYMVLTWQEPQENRDLLEALQMKSSQDLPCLLVLFPERDTEEAYVHSIRIQGATVEETFNSIRQSVLAITEAIDEVSSEHLKNAEGVHAAVGLRLQTLKQWAMVKKGMSFIKWVRSLSSRGDR